MKNDELEDKEKETGEFTTHILAVQRLPMGICFGNGSYITEFFKLKYRIDLGRAYPVPLANRSNLQDNLRLVA